MGKEKCLLLLSGGLDSTTLLAKLINNNYDVFVINIQYGSKHNEQELKAFYNIINYYKISNFRLINIESIIKLFKSSLLINNNNEIPEGHYHQENMKSTIVPFRNGIMLSIVTGFAESHDIKYINIASHSGDHYIYPDCRPDFNKAMQNAIYSGTINNIIVQYPFQNEDKESIVKMGLKLQVPYHLTYTCYKGRSKSCKRCASCVERLEAFQNNNVKDPIRYE